MRVRQAVCNDGRLTVRLILEELNKKKDSVCKIITRDVSMWKVYAKMVPILQNNDQKELHIQDITERIHIESD